ncbi:CDP-diacylglycerol--glycerol-3-phosphate 3-phosphatidyltransferase [Murinocardiopsis flavida]|uniref:Phosphatidylinositol phosphate synthase n=1 Tax=Murinocardiopsis flavida TaxID=645275 RepID=A0A2P8DKC0_9ACTN|nr:CDP-alcohol phosphatidyltransferase family protein [Murinocardiopsis flavida]PSK97672.1 CDP-diacylglycerol--glycerol-3-phosphate 3-phosphatidyltransferase [Murinocardiopsis flavida]
MLRILRPVIARLLAPLGRGLARVGLTPNTVTFLGTTGVVASALYFYPRGELLAGTLMITVFALFDMVDGAVARASDAESRWGAFLDSTLDRLADAAILSGLILWFTGGGDSLSLAAITLFCLVTGFGVSYVKARAEALGANCDVGIAERTERLIVLLTAVGLNELGVPHALPVGLVGLALISAITIAQRLIETRARLTEPRQAADSS